MILAILSGVLSVMFAITPTPFIILSLILNYFAAVPLYYIGLTSPYTHLISSCLVSLSLFFLYTGFLPAAIFGFSVLVPALLTVYRLNRNDSVGCALSWVTGYVLFIMIGALVIVLLNSVDISHFLKSWLSEISEKTPLKKIDPQIFSLLPGIIAVTWIIMCLSNVSLTRKFLQKTHPQRNMKHFLHDMLFHDKWDIVMAFAMLLILTKSYFFAFIGKNIALVCAVPLYLIGLKIMIGLLRQLGYSRSWATGIILLSILLVWPGIFIVILGVLEPTLRFYLMRIKNKPD